jgi:uroporphyrinogen decarboxylase
MVRRLKSRHPDVPVIGFPRGAGLLSADYVARTGVDGVGCDTAMPLGFMRDTLAKQAAIQGNLDPLLLVAGGALLESRIRHILSTFEGLPHIFNLGHGILQTTPVEHVERLVEILRS